MTWIDIVFIAIISIFALIGLVKGLLDSILSLFTSLFSFGLAIYLSKPVAQFIRDLVDIDGWFNTFLKETLQTEETIQFLGQSFAREEIAAFLTIVFCVILMFFFIRSAIALVSKLFDSVTNSSTALSGLNRLLGLVFGGIKGLFLTGIVLAICSIITSLGLPIVSNAVANTIQDSKITSFYYKFVDQFVEDKLSGKSLDEIISGMIDNNTDNEEEEEEQEQDDSPKIEVQTAFPSTLKDVYTLGETPDFSMVLVIYTSDGETNVIQIYSTNFFPQIDTSTLGTREVEIWLNGISTIFTYTVIEAP